MKKTLFVLIALNSLLFSLCVQPNDPNYYLAPYNGDCVPVNPLPPLGSMYCANNKNEIGDRYENGKYCYIVYNAYLISQCTAPNVKATRNGYSYCETPKQCTSPLVLDSVTNTCKLSDADGDGTPDKCDTSFANYAAADCDGDGIPNSTDDDIDGDGSKNNMDVDENGDGIPDSSDPNSAKFNAACQGADFSTNTSYGAPHPVSEYSYKGVMTPSSCLAQTDDPNIDGSLIFNDKNSNCYNTYCYIHTLTSACNYYASDYIPDGNLWTRKLNVSSETQCASYVDNVLYSDKVFVVPDASACPDHKYCFLKRTLPTPVQDSTNSETSDSTMQSPDLNSTSSDLSPLLQASNTTNTHLKDLKDKTDITHTKLEDLKTTANSILNSSTDMSSTLSSIKTGVDRTASNSLEALSSLGSISDGISASNVASVATNANLIGIGGKIDTTNSLLTTINASLAGDGTSPDTSVLNGAESALTDFDGFVDGVTSQYSTFKDNIQGNLDDVMNQYNNTKSILTSGQAPTMSGGGSLECASFNVFGKHVVLDLSFLSVLSPVFYYIFTAYFMFLNFSFLLRHLFGSGN